MKEIKADVIIKMEIPNEIANEFVINEICDILTYCFDRHSKQIDFDICEIRIKEKY